MNMKGRERERRNRPVNLSGAEVDAGRMLFEGEDARVWLEMMGRDFKAT